MTNFWGADPAQLRELSSTVSARSSRIVELFTALDGLVFNTAHWSGPDADSFRSNYISSVRPSADALASELSRRSMLLVSEADQQDAASAHDGTGTGGVSSAGGASTPAGLPGEGSAASADVGYWDNRGDERSARRGEGRGNIPRVDGDDSFDHSVHSLAREGADLQRGKWPSASEHLDHFLDNTGEDFEADVDSLISDQPAFAQQTEERRHVAGRDAVAQAQSDGASGPVTYPLSTPWAGHTADGDWFYASGSFNHNQTGTVTVYPPDANNPDWRYEVDTQVNFRDRYNWDGWKSTTIGPFTVNDESLAALHRGGIAKEYNLIGASSPQHSEGTVP